MVGFSSRDSLSAGMSESFLRKESTIGALIGFETATTDFEFCGFLELNKFLTRPLVFLFENDYYHSRAKSKKIFVRNNSFCIFYNFLKYFGFFEDWKIL